MPRARTGSPQKRGGNDQRGVKVIKGNRRFDVEVDCGLRNEEDWEFSIEDD